MADFFENLTFSNEDIITFADGLPGFENRKKFVIVKVPEYAPFEWLVCTDGSKLRFAILNPMHFCPDYAPNIKKSMLEELQIKKPDDILMYVLITIKDDPSESTANLIGPVLINKTNKLAKQLILDDEKYTTREPILRKS